MALAPQHKYPREVKERRARRGGHSKCREAAAYIMVSRSMFGITLIHVDTVYLIGTLDSNLYPGSHTDSEKH